MSTPPDQPSASPYPNSPSGPGGSAASPPPEQTPGGYGTPVPPQHNPYAQPSPYGPPGYYAPAGAPPGMPGVPGMPGAVGMPGGVPGGPQPAGRRRRGAGRALLWVLVGAAVASAAWAGGVLLLNKDAKADLRGYKVKPDLCDTADLSAFKPDYTPSSSHTAWSATGKSLDQMTCSESMDASSSSDGESGYLYIYIELNHKTDPEPEFADTWLGYKQHKDETYDVVPVSGFGDEAYLVTEDSVTSSDGSSSGDRYITLALRDGWMTYYINWNQFGSSSSDSTPLPSVDQVTDWLKTSTKATLVKLKK